MGGGGVDVVGGWEAEGGLYHPLVQGQSHCALMKHRNSHSVHVRPRRLLAAV